MFRRRVLLTLVAVLAPAMVRGAEEEPAAGPAEAAGATETPAPVPAPGGDAAAVAPDAAIEAVGPSEPDAAPLPPPPPPPPPEPPKPEVNPSRRAIAASDSVVIGTLADVSPADAAGPSASASFTVEKALLGYGNFRAPITVRFPARGGAEPPSPGRALLILSGSRSDGSFVALDAVPLPDAAAEEEARRLVSEALGPRRARLTTIQATLAEWQDAWNARDIGRCILCYGRASRLRRRYASGGGERRALQRQLRASPGTVAIEIDAIRLVLAPTSEGASETAEVYVTLTLAARAGEERRERATMTFVREKGEWLILAEGF
jgi:hypothetical protein